MVSPHLDDATFMLFTLHCGVLRNDEFRCSKKYRVVNLRSSSRIVLIGLKGDEGSLPHSAFLKSGNIPYEIIPTE